MSAPPNQPPGGTPAGFDPVPGAAPPPPWHAQYPPRKDENMALVALLMAVGAWVVHLHVLLAIPAIIVGFMARKKIRLEPDRYGGDGLAKAAIIVGFVNVGIWVVVPLLLVLLYAAILLLVFLGAGASALMSA